MSRVPSLMIVLAFAGCESNLITNEPLPHVDAGLFARDSGRRDATAPRDAQSVDVDPEVEEELPPDGEQEPPQGEPDSATPSETDAGTGSEPVAESVIRGTASNCSSYGLRKDGMCAGYYCSVSIDDLTAEYTVKPGAKCDTTPERICEGQFTRDVAKCARDTKSNPLNALDSTETIREKTADCVMKLPANVDTKPECLDCFLDAAQCASDNCLTQCLTGDSATCDKCRLDNNCNQPVPTCAGFPTPF